MGVFCLLFWGFCCCGEWFLLFAVVVLVFLIVFYCTCKKMMNPSNIFKNFLGVLFLASLYPFMYHLYLTVYTRNISLDCYDLICPFLVWTSPVVLSYPLPLITLNFLIYVISIWGGFHVVKFISEILDGRKILHAKGPVFSLLLHSKLLVLLPLH